MSNIRTHQLNSHAHHSKSHLRLMDSSNISQTDNSDSAWRSPSIKIGHKMNQTSKKLAGMLDTSKNNIASGHTMQDVSIDQSQGAKVVKNGRSFLVEPFNTSCVYSPSHSPAHGKSIRQRVGIMKPASPTNAQRRDINAAVRKTEPGQHSTDDNSAQGILIRP